MIKTLSLVRILAALSAGALLFACEDPDVLVVECVDPGDPLPAGGWVCGEDTAVECAGPNGAVVHTIYAQLETGTCSDASLTVSAEGPFPLGPHSISVTLSTGDIEGQLLCTSGLTIVDTTPPVVTPKTTELWPPNHKFHTITIEDCVSVSDVCDPDVDVTFTYATSDEPRNSTGDGNTDVDIANFGCKSVDVLSERKGNGDARVYHLGYRAVDASGNTTEGACQVIVAHDQGGKIPVDSGEAYKEEAPACL
jgi:hypothetical protein